MSNQIWTKSKERYAIVPMVSHRIYGRIMKLENEEVYIYETSHYCKQDDYSATEYRPGATFSTEAAALAGLNKYLENFTYIGVIENPSY